MLKNEEECISDCLFISLLFNVQVLPSLFFSRVLFDFLYMKTEQLLL